MPDPGTDAPAIDRGRLEEELCRAAARATFAAVAEECAMAGVALPVESRDEEAHVENTWRWHIAPVRAVLLRLEQGDAAVDAAGMRALDAVPELRFGDLFAAMVREWRR